MLSYTALEVDPVLGTSNHPLTLFYCRSTVISVCGFTFNEDAYLTVDARLEFMITCLLHSRIFVLYLGSLAQRRKERRGLSVAVPEMRRRDGTEGRREGQTARRGARLISISVSEEEAVPPSFHLSTVTESVFQ